MNNEREREHIISHPDWRLFEESLSPDTPEPVVELLHQYYDARIKILDGDRDAAKKLYGQMDMDLLDTLEEEESGDINLIGVILTGTNIFDAPSDLHYFDKERMKTTLQKLSDPSSN